MNNKGFTMIELIMVILILALFAFITTPNVIKLINRNNRDNYNDSIDTIIEATKIYVSDNRYELEFKDSTGNNSFCTPNDSKDIYSYITLQDLVNSKDLSSPIVNVCTKEELDSDTLNSIEIKITLNCSSNTFTNFELGENVKYLKKVTDITDNLGRINEGYYCSDLY